MWGFEIFEKTVGTKRRSSPTMSSLFVYCSLQTDLYLQCRSSAEKNEDKPKSRGLWVGNEEEEASSTDEESLEESFKRV